MIWDWFFPTVYHGIGILTGSISEALGLDVKRTPGSTRYPEPQTERTKGKTLERRIPIRCLH